MRAYLGRNHGEGDASQRRTPWLVHARMVERGCSCETAIGPTCGFLVHSECGFPVLTGLA